MNRRRRTVRWVSVTALVAAVVLSGAPARAAGPDLGAVALRAGLTGDDLSPVFRLDARDALPAGLAERPRAAFVTHAVADPALRVHSLPGVPGAERAEQAAKIAARTLRFCQALGLAAPADDGDGELDLFLLPLRGVGRGYAVLEAPLPPGRGASGFAVVDAGLDAVAFDDMVARVVARLVLDAHDAAAPPWWLEPSVTWIAERITGLSPEMDRWLEARWNQPERGPFVADPILARGNAALLWAMDDPALAGRFVAAAWAALGARVEAETAATAIDGAARQVTGAGLDELWLRAAIAHLGSGDAPVRWAGRVGPLPHFEQQAPVTLAPLGLAMVRLAPDAGHPDGTRLSVAPSEPGWRAEIVARRRGAGWDRAPLAADARGGLAVTVPWNDYDQAVLLLVRPAAAPGEGTFRLQAESADRAGLYALSSFGARAIARDRAEIAWSTAWEEGLFGWLVERAPASEGPWRPILATPVPALGLPREGSEYVVHDEVPKGTPWLFYRIVVLTAEGLRVTGPSVAVRTR